MTGGQNLSLLELMIYLSLIILTLKYVCLWIYRNLDGQMIGVPLMNVASGVNDFIRWNFGLIKMLVEPQNYPTGWRFNNIVKYKFMMQIVILFFIFFK